MVRCYCYALRGEKSKSNQQLIMERNKMTDKI